MLLLLLRSPDAPAAPAASLDDMRMGPRVQLRRRARQDDDADTDDDDLELANMILNIIRRQR